MPIYIKDKEITLVYIGRKALNAIYRKSSVVFEAALRIWKGKSVWKGKEMWKY